jgi:hypothetical protein
MEQRRKCDKCFRKMEIRGTTFVMTMIAPYPQRLSTNPEGASPAHCAPARWPLSGQKGKYPLGSRRNSLKRRVSAEPMQVNPGAFIWRDLAGLGLAWLDLDQSGVDFEKPCRRSAQRSIARSDTPYAARQTRGFGRRSLDSIPKFALEAPPRVVVSLAHPSRTMIGGRPTVRRPSPAEYR